MTSSEKVNIQILGQSYPVQCAPDEVATLEAVTAHINSVIIDIRAQAPSLAREQLLVLTCLTITQDLFEAQKSEQEIAHSKKILQKITNDMQKILMSEKI